MSLRVNPPKRQESWGIYTPTPSAIGWGPLRAGVNSLALLACHECEQVGSGGQRKSSGKEMQVLTGGNWGQHPLKWEWPRGKNEALTACATVTIPPCDWSGAELALLGHVPDLVSERPQIPLVMVIVPVRIGGNCPWSKLSQSTILSLENSTRNIGQEITELRWCKPGVAEDHHMEKACWKMKPTQKPSAERQTLSPDEIIWILGFSQVSNSCPWAF